MYKPGSDSSFHTICELTKEGRSFVVDTVNDRYVEIIFERLNNNKEKLKELWPDEPVYYDCIEGAISFIPSLPGDFLPKNQLLYNVLSKIDSEKTPIFGFSPEKRLLLYKEYLKKNDVKNPIPIIYWHYPIRLLSAQIKKNQTKNDH